MRPGFHKKYFILLILLLLTEVIIALFVRDRFIRPYGGDVLAVMVVYCTIKSFLSIKTHPALLISLFIAVSIELSQYFKLVELFGLKPDSMAGIIIGNSFSWEDIVAYVAGILIIYFLERKIHLTQIQH